MIAVLSHYNQTGNFYRCDIPRNNDLIRRLYAARVIMGSNS